MRYLKDIGDLDEETVVRAENIFEKLTGYCMALDTYNEILGYSDTAGAKLSHDPVTRLISVRGRTNDWGNLQFNQIFGTSDWIDIDISQVTLLQKPGLAIIVLPPTIFGTSYSEVNVTYEAGVGEVPDDVQDAIRKMAVLIQERKLDEWNIVLPADIVDVVNKYRKG